MLKLRYRNIVLFFVFSSVFAQTESEVPAPFHIKTVSFLQSNVNMVPIFKLGEGFLFQFDDLQASEANYYFEIVHCDYNWKPSNIPKNEYLKGVDGQRILQYENSLNTLQIYSHYKLPVPNQFMQLRISGNYMLKILDESKEVVLSRKFILYEDLVSVPIQLRRARTMSDFEAKHNVEFTIKSTAISFQNPLKNVKVLLFQNGQFNAGIKNISPQFTIGNDLIYKYDKETQFWSGNEFLFFDNSDIRSPGNNISRIDSKNDIYNSYLFTNGARGNFPYSFTQDINGGFLVRNIAGGTSEIEADYAWVYFSLSAPSFMQRKSVYVTGMFNNFSLSDENKMDYNPSKNIFEKAILIKQGFNNFQYQIADNQGKIDHESAIDGNFWQTENDYGIVVYYRANNDRYDRVIGQAKINSTFSLN